MQLPPRVMAQIEAALAEGSAVETTKRVAPPPAVVDLAASERAAWNEGQFSRAVTDLAHSHGWTVASVRPGRVRVRGKDTYRTPMGDDGNGFPDKLLIRLERLIVAELKVKPNKPTRDQKKWLKLFEGAGVETHVWYPEDWHEIVLALNGKWPDSAALVERQRAFTEPPQEEEA